MVETLQEERGRLAWVEHVRIFVLSFPCEHTCWHPIATRRYGVEGEPGREIVLVIGQPIPSGSSNGDWVCPVLISGLETEVFKCAEGIGGIQTIQQAMQLARSELDGCGLPITWLDQEPGDVGLPLPIDGPFGLWFQHKLEMLLNLKYAGWPRFVKSSSRSGKDALERSLEADGPVVPRRPPGRAPRGRR